MNNKKTLTLTDIKPGESGEIKSISDGGLSSRFLSIGIVAGDAAEKLFSGAFGKISAFRFGDIVIALRKSDSDCVKLG